MNTVLLTFKRCLFFVCVSGNFPFSFFLLPVRTFRFRFSKTVFSFFGLYSSSFKGYAYDMLQFIGKLCGGMAPDDFTQQLKKTVIYTDYTHDPTSSLYRIDGDNYSGMGMYIPNSFTTPKYLLWNNYFKSSIAWYHASGWAETESIWGN